MRFALSLANGDAVTFVLNRPPVTMYRLLHDYEMGEARPDARPETCRFQDHHYSPLTKAWQFRWYEENGGRLTDPDGKRWTGYTGWDDFITNDKGTDFFRNWITGERLDKDDPGIQTLGCGGGLVAGHETVERGVKVLAIKTFNGNQPPPKGFSHRTTPWLWQYATIATLTKLPDGTMKVNPFTHLPNGVLFPLISRFQVYYPLERIKKIPRGAPLTSPYNPPRPI